MADLKLGYCNFFVSDFDRSLRFFRDQLGMKVIRTDEQFGYASFDTGSTSMAFATVDSQTQPELPGRHTGIGLVTPDIHAAYAEMIEQGVEFDQAPTKQPWGGVIGLFRDPDGNVFYLDQATTDT